MNQADPKRNTRYNSPGQAEEGFLARQSDDLPMWAVQPRSAFYTRCYEWQQLTCRYRGDDQYHLAQSKGGYGSPGWTTLVVKESLRALAQIE